LRLFGKWLICCGAILLAWAVFPNWIDFSGSWAAAIGMGTVLWLINLFIRPVAQVVSIVVTLITLGIFSLIVNACMVWLADKIVGAVDIQSFWICIFIAFVISAGNAALLPKGKKKADDDAYRT
jgi:putative membrane protein